MYMLKSVGESTPPCGTPVFVFLSVDFLVVVGLTKWVCLVPPRLCPLHDCAHTIVTT